MAVEHAQTFSPVAPAVEYETPRADRALYVLWAVFWLLMLTVAIQDTLHSPAIHWWEPVLWEGSSAVFATVWMLMQRRIADRRYRAWLDRPLAWFGQHLKWLPLISASFIVMVYGFRHGVYGMLGETYGHEPWPFVFVYETVKLLLFAGLWLGIIFGFDSFAAWRSQRERLLALQRSLSEAQLARLEAQLRPHFLFNALNTISSLMQVDVPRADRLLARLGELLRASLQAGERDSIALREEIRLLELYAQVMEERFAGRVRIEWQLDEKAMDAAVPALLLQPLLENAFKHGIERSLGMQTIRIAVERRDGRLHLRVHNMGGTLDEQPREGVGLRNCRERLQVLHGAGANLELTADDTGVTAHVELPFRECTE